MKSFATRDISNKPHTLRSAKAIAVLKASPATLEAIRSGAVPKADPIGVAKVAGIQAAKNTSFLIPHCHQVPLDFIGVDIELGADVITVATSVKAIWKTGVEMEALVAASSSALALYDMLKIIDGGMEITSVRLVEKKGGKSSSSESGEGLTAAVLVLSDSVSQGRKDDSSGKFLAEKLKAMKLTIAHFKVLPDDSGKIEHELRSLVDEYRVDLIMTTGGTGIGPRDVTPEATMAVIERRLEGVEQALRTFGQDRVPTAMLSRGIVGIRGRSLIVNLPGSIGGVEDGVDAIFPSILHTFRMLRGEGHEQNTEAKAQKKKG